MLTDRGQLQGEGRRAPRTRVDDGGRYLSTPKPKASHRLHQRSTASLTARPSRVPFLTTENTATILGWNRACSSRSVRHEQTRKTILTLKPEGSYNQNTGPATYERVK